MTIVSIVNLSSSISSLFSSSQHHNSYLLDRHMMLTALPRRPKAPKTNVRTPRIQNLARMIASDNLDEVDDIIMMGILKIMIAWWWQQGCCLCTMKSKIKEKQIKMFFNQFKFYCNDDVLKRVMLKIKMCHDHYRLEKIC